MERTPRGSSEVSLSLMHSHSYFPLRGIFREIVAITRMIQQLSSQGKIVQILIAQDNASEIAVHVSKLDRILADLKVGIWIYIVGIAVLVGFMINLIRRLQSPLEWVSESTRLM